MKENINAKELKKKICPRIKKRIKPNINKVIPNIYKTKEKNSNFLSNSKSITNSKTNKNITISNNSESTSRQKNNDKILINNLTNDDKDLETILSDLKTQKTRNSNKNNNEEETNIISNKNNNNSNLLYNNDGFNLGKIIESNDINLIDLNFDFDEPGHEISQRVHTKKAKTYCNLLTKEKCKNNSNYINNLNEKNINNKNLRSSINNSYMIKNNKNNKHKESSIKKNILLKNVNKKKLTSLRKKKKLFKNKTSNHKINSIPILVKLNSLSIKKNKRRNINLKMKQIGYTKTHQKFVTCYDKNYRTSIGNNASFANKREISSPKGCNLSKRINNKNNLKKNLSKDKNNNNKINHCKIGDFYIKKNFKKLKNDKIRLKLFDFKRSRSKTNQNRNKSYEFEKFNNYTKKNNNLNLSEMKRSFDGYRLNKQQNIFNKINLNLKRKIPNKIPISCKNNREYKFHNLKKYIYYNLIIQKKKIDLIKNKTEKLFPSNNEIKKIREKKIPFINKNKFKINNSAKNIEITI